MPHIRRTSQSTTERRGFLKGLGCTASAAFLGGCVDQQPGHQPQRTSEGTLMGVSGNIPK